MAQAYTLSLFSFLRMRTFGDVVPNYHQTTTTSIRIKQGNLYNFENQLPTVAIRDVFDKAMADTFCPSIFIRCMTFGKRIRKLRIKMRKFLVCFPFPRFTYEVKQA